MPNLSLIEWEALGEQLCKHRAISDWLLGDWWLARRAADFQGVRQSVKHILPPQKGGT